MTTRTTTATTTATRFVIPNWVALLLVLLLLTGSSAHLDPYRAFSVASTAPQGEIRQRYRELCLRYHPDKNTHKSTRERQQCEDQFKHIQAAYDLIGTPEARARYDDSRFNPFRNTAAFPGFDNSFTSGNHEGNFAADPTSEKAFQQFYTRGHASRTTQSTPFYPFYSTHPLRNPYSSYFGDGGWRSAFPLWKDSSLKSVYVQRVRVPFQDLFRGRDHYTFVLTDHKMWHRALAAFRGGTGYLLLYQALLYALPVVRISRWLAFGLAVYIFQSILPEPSTMAYRGTILPGYKGNTKFIFKDTQDPNIEVIFILVEGTHPIYQRHGNDLHVSKVITPELAAMGGVLELEPVMEEPIKIKLPPGLIQKSGDQLVVKSEGWPYRNTKKTVEKEGATARGVMGRGDLIVTFQLVSTRRKRKTTPHR